MEELQHLVQTLASHETLHLKNIRTLSERTATQQRGRLDTWKLCLATLAFCALFEAASITGKGDWIIGPG